MGRSSRKGMLPADRDGLQPGGGRLHWTDQHPDRKHWTPHQRALARMMTREAYEGLYGRGVTPQQEISLESPFWKSISPEDRGRLLSGTFSSAEAREFLSGAQGVSGATIHDPVFQAFWDSEMRRLEIETARMPGHWFEKYKNPEAREALRRAWHKEVVPGISNPTTNRYSLLSAALLADPPWKLDELEFSNYLRSVPVKDVPRFFEEHIQPELCFLTGSSRQPSDEVLHEIWDMASHWAGGADLARSGELHPGEARTAIAARLAHDAGRRFTAEPVLGRRSLAGPGAPVLQEAFARTSHLIQKSTPEEALVEMRKAYDQMLGEYLVRIYAGLEDPLDESEIRDQEEAVVNQPRRIFGGRERLPLPLDNLRPLFVGEQQEELFSEIDEFVRKQMRGGRLLNMEKVLSMQTIDSSKLRMVLSGGGTISDLIASEIYHRLLPPAGSHFF